MTVEITNEQITAILTACQLVNGIEVSQLPSIVLKVMTEVEQKYAQCNKLELALQVIQKVLPDSDKELVRSLITSFIQVSKNPQIIQTINLVKQAAERIDDELSQASDKPPKQCCVIA